VVPLGLICCWLCVITTAALLALDKVRSSLVNGGDDYGAWLPFPFTLEICPGPPTMPELFWSRIPKKK